MYLYSNTVSDISKFCRNDTGKIGMQNLGNTCYINAVIQCLLNIPQLSEFLQSNFRQNSDVRESIIVREFVKINNSYWNVHANTPNDRSHKPVMSPEKFVLSIFNATEQFKFGEQHDASEFLVFLLEGIHKFTCINVKFNIHQSNKSSILDRLRLASYRAWKRYFNKEYSIISDLFYGQYKNTITCMNCTRETHAFEPFCVIDLPIVSKMNITLKECFANYMKSEVLDSPRKCTKCRKLTQSRKNIIIWRYPRILIISLKRFNKCFKKINDFVSYPDDIQFESSLDKKNISYLLSSVIYHDGSYHTGHYHSACKSIGKEKNLSKWYHYNDDTMSVLHPDNVLQSNGYILFYQMKT